VWPAATTSPQPRITRTTTATTLTTSNISPDPEPIPLPKDAIMRPDFNEFPMWSNNNQDRSNAKIDLILLHTQEAESNALGLANFIKSTEGLEPTRSHITARFVRRLLAIMA
jgi:hypothetical protein